MQLATVNGRQARAMWRSGPWVAVPVALHFSLGLVPSDQSSPGQRLRLRLARTRDLPRTVSSIRFRHSRQGNGRVRTVHVRVCRGTQR